MSIAGGDAQGVHPDTRIELNMAEIIVRLNFAYLSPETVWQHIAFYISRFINFDYEASFSAELTEVKAKICCWDKQILKK